MLFSTENSRSALGLPLWSRTEVLFEMHYCFVSEKTPREKATQTLQAQVWACFECAQTDLPHASDTSTCSHS